jgi:hypothetical protein
MWKDVEWISLHKNSTGGTEENNKKFWEELIAYFPWYNMDYIENDVSNNSYIVACVFITVVTFLLSRCLATLGGYTYRHTEWWEGFFN